MASTDPQASASASPEVALIVGGGPGISASCARLFAQSGMAVAIAARNRDKPVLQSLVQSHGVRPYGCDAADATDVASLFEQVARDLGAVVLVEAARGPRLQRLGAPVNERVRVLHT